MAITLDGNLGITTPAETVQGALTTTGNTILGDASTDTLNVGAGGLVKDASGNVGIGTASPSAKLDVQVSGATLIQSLIGASGVYQRIGTATSNLYTVHRTTDTFIYTDGATPLLFGTNSAEQARISSTGVFSFNSGYGSAATAYGCRAWVNFNGSGTPAIRASGNVSSITDVNVGNFAINFTTAMVDANYCPTATAEDILNGNFVSGAISPAPTTASFTFYVVNASGVIGDPGRVNIGIFR